MPSYFGGHLLNIPKEEPGLKERWFEESYSKADWKVLKVLGLWDNEECESAVENIF